MRALAACAYRAQCARVTGEGYAMLFVECSLLALTAIIAGWIVAEAIDAVRRG